MSKGVQRVVPTFDSARDALAVTAPEQGEMIRELQVRSSHAHSHTTSPFLFLFSLIPSTTLSIYPFTSCHRQRKPPTLLHGSQAQLHPQSKWQMQKASSCWCVSFKVNTSSFHTFLSLTHSLSPMLFFFLYIPHPTDEVDIKSLLVRKKTPTFLK
jgi:hypothetical protein